MIFKYKKYSHLTIDPVWTTESTKKIKQNVLIILKLMWIQKYLFDLEKLVCLVGIDFGALRFKILFPNMLSVIH